VHELANGWATLHPRHFLIGRIGCPFSFQSPKSWVDNHLDDQLVFHRVGREVNNSRYDGTDTKRPLINSL
jgi:hypothetical protein